MIDDITRQQQTREIELELIRVRAAAEAARLEARAAELELLLRRIASGSDVDLPAALFTSTPRQTEYSNYIAAPEQRRDAPRPDGWSSRISRMQARDQSSQAPNPNASNAAPADPVARFHEQVEQRLWQRSDAVSTSRPPAPHFLQFPESIVSKEDKPEILDHAPITELKVAPKPNVAEIKPTLIAPTITPSQLTTPTPPVLLNERHPGPIDELAKSSKPTQSPAQKPRKPSVLLPAIKSIDGDDESLEPKRRFRPASFLVSTLAHVVVLILLGAATLATKQPKDQMAFTSSATESSEETMETFAIESSEPMDENEPVPTETAYEVSTVGTMAITEVSMDLPPAPAPPTTSDLLSSSSSSLSSSAMKSLKSDSNMKSQFCGVDGGGNHFVYLVDSSGSMRDGFQSARTELLASIDQLKPDQRFYVVFFDEEPDYMRISDPRVDESASVMATAENKRRLRTWAMNVEMNKGKAPYEILPFALLLRPDVIFLLSDGEFPVKIEEILREKNRQENLFGESGPISIVHTIRYHGIEGESGRKAEETMVKIAKENGGQYRHVPKPKN